MSIEWINQYSHLLYSLLDHIAKANGGLYRIRFTFLDNEFLLECKNSDSLKLEYLKKFIEEKIINHENFLLFLNMILLSSYTITRIDIFKITTLISIVEKDIEKDKEI